MQNGESEKNDSNKGKSKRDEFPNEITAEAPTDSIYPSSNIEPNAIAQDTFTNRLINSLASADTMMQANELSRMIGPNQKKQAEDVVASRKHERPHRKPLTQQRRKQHKESVEQAALYDKAQDNSNTSNEQVDEAQIVEHSDSTHAEDSETIDEGNHSHQGGNIHDDRAVEEPSNEKSNQDLDLVRAQQRDDMDDGIENFYDSNFTFLVMHA